MRLIKHKRYACSWCAFQPPSCEFKDSRLNGADQHILKHGVVRDQYIRRRGLDVPPAEHLCAVRTRPGAGVAQISAQLFPILPELFKICCEAVPRLLVGPVSGGLRHTGIHTEVNNVPLQTFFLPLRRGTAGENTAQTRELIVHQGIHRVENERAHCRWATFMPPTMEPASL